MLVATTSVPRGAFSEVTSASVLGAGVQRPGGYEGGSQGGWLVVGAGVACEAGGTACPLHARARGGPATCSGNPESLAGQGEQEEVACRPCGYKGTLYWGF